MKVKMYGYAWKDRDGIAVGRVYNRHDDLVREMRNRNFNHQSPLADVPLEGPEDIDRFLDSVPRQINILKDKGCSCRV